jgi:hypothetical protein
MVRKHKAAVNGSIYENVKKVIQRMGCEELFDFNDNTSKIKCYNGNSFVPLGLYEAKGITGPGKGVVDPTDAIVDEIDECTEDEFEKLFFTLRGSEDTECFGIFNTHKIDEEHWIMKRWFPPRETFEEMDGSHTYIKSTRNYAIILHTTYLMNPFCTEKYKREFEEQKKNAPERYAVSGLGLIKVIKQSNMALGSFDRMEHVSESVKFNKSALVYLSWDFNRLPHHTVGMWQFGGCEDGNYNWNLVKEFCLPDKSVKQVQEHINKWLKSQGYESKKVVIVCDYSGGTKRDHDRKSDIYRITNTLEKGGFEASNRTVVNPSVLASLDFLNDCFDGLVKVSSQNPKHGGATIRIQISPECKYHIADFEKTKTDHEGKILKQTKRDAFIEDGAKVNRTYQVRGHAVDGTRYIITTIFNFEYKQNKTA